MKSMKSKKAMKRFPDVSPKSNKYERWEHTRTKIDTEWEDIKSYNQSFKVGPPCDYRTFLEGNRLLSSCPKYFSLLFLLTINCIQLLMGYGAMGLSYGL